MRMSKRNEYASIFICTPTKCILLQIRAVRITILHIYSEYIASFKEVHYCAYILKYCSYLLLHIFCWQRATTKRISNVIQWIKRPLACMYTMLYSVYCVDCRIFMYIICHPAYAYVGTITSPSHIHIIPHRTILLLFTVAAAAAHKKNVHDVIHFIFFYRWCFM